MKIGVNTELLSEIYANLQSYKEDFTTLVGSIGTEIGTIPDAWDGDAAVAYGEQWDDLKNNTLNEVENLLDTIGIQVGEVIAAMEEMDDSIAGVLRGGI